METLLFENVKQFFIDNPDKVPNDPGWDLSEGAPYYELDPGYWFSEAQPQIQQEIIAFSNWELLQQGTDLIGLKLNRKELSSWESHVSTFADIIIFEYDNYEGPQLYWKHYGLGGDNDVDYCGTYLHAGVSLIITYFKYH